MKHRLNRSILFGVAFLMMQLMAYADDFTYKREVKGVTGTWHKLIVPDDLFVKANTDLSDIRIIGVTSNNDTIEAPYLGDLHIEFSETRNAPFKLLNQTKNNAGYYFTFEIEGDRSINYIDLEFENENFDWRVFLAGSDDQKEWFTVVEDYRIVSIKNQLTDYSFTTLKFAESKYRYYRLLVPSTVKPKLTSAQISNTVVTPGLYREYAAKVSSSIDKAHKQTSVNVELPAAVPVSWLAVYASDKFDFYRPVTIQYLTDSNKTATGTEYIYTTITTGVLSSIEQPVFRFGHTVTRNFRLLIDNGDNQPLHIDSVIAKGNVYDLTIRFPEKASYFLYYGNKNISQPDYDLPVFKDKIPAGLSEVTLGEEQVIPKTPVPVVKPLFENKIWLWAIMAVIILLLGWFSVKMMRAKQ